MLTTPLVFGKGLQSSQLLAALLCGTGVLEDQPLSLAAQ